MPLTVSVNAAPPAVALFGDSELTVGDVPLAMVTKTLADDRVITSRIVGLGGQGNLAIRATPRIPGHLVGSAARATNQCRVNVEIDSGHSDVVGRARRKRDNTGDGAAARRCNERDGRRLRIGRDGEGTGIRYATVRIGDGDLHRAGGRDVGGGNRRRQLHRAHERARACHPVQRTPAPLTKLVPLTVSVNAAPPAVALFGDSELTVGDVPLAMVTKTLADDR